MTSVGTQARLRLRVLHDFDDPALDPVLWERLLAAGATAEVSLTLEWQREWWRAFGGDRLLIVVAERDGELRAIAPLFELDEMLFVVGIGQSDYLDFIGELDEPTLTAMLAAARSEMSEFTGVALYHLPLASRTTSLLPGVARRLGLTLYCEPETSAPYLDLTDDEAVRRWTDRKRVRQEETRMRRAGDLHFRTAASPQLDPWLEQFYSLHSSRWTAEGGLEGARERAFLRAIVHAGHSAGWLRFTMLEWRGRPAAFDISLVRHDRMLAYLVARDSSIRQHSPGKVLERHLIAAAAREGLSVLDLGRGDEEYKVRAASGVAEIASWSLYA
jgi:CelD/BcsL family acetyltransferase involved in cellulose biosynthesis